MAVWLHLPVFIFPKNFHSVSSLFKPYTSDEYSSSLPFQPPMITQAKLVSGRRGTHFAYLTTHGSGGPWTHFWLLMDHFVPIDQRDFLSFTFKISKEFEDSPFLSNRQLRWYIALIHHQIEWHNWSDLLLVQASVVLWSNCPFWYCKWMSAEIHLSEIK